MSILLILLGLLIILVILKLFTERSIERSSEGFEDIPLNPETIQGYKNFLSFYNPFCTSWDKAITSSAASEIPQEPLTDPSQVSDGGSGSAPPISTEQKNKHINELSSQLNQQFPPICEKMPDLINSSNLADVLNKIPQDTQPFINALTWVNMNLQKGQANLGGALQGQSEGFEDCQDISNCLLNNPELLQELATGISEQNAIPIIEQQKQLMTKIIPFFNTPELSQAFGENTILMEKAQDIQNQAQSGELLNQVNVPGGNTIATYQMPAGASNMSDMKQNNPERYNELKTNYSQWYSLKSMLDNINAYL
jgi:hypothetical protein